MRYCRRLALILCALMLSTGSATAMGQERDLRFGFTPVLSASEMRAEFEPLMTYLS